MSLMNDIRAQMARESGAVTAAEIAETLGEDPKKVRSAMYQAALQGAGIERGEDGSYQLIPNWKPLRGGEASTETTEPESSSETTPASSPKAVAVRRGRKPKAAVAKPKRRAPSTRGARKISATPTRTAAAPISDDDLVQVSRGTLRVLTIALLESDRPLTSGDRNALLSLIRPAA